jgi:hypothetical protein
MNGEMYEGELRWFGYCNGIKLDLLGILVWQGLYWRWRQVYDTGEHLGRRETIWHLEM